MLNSSLQYFHTIRYLRPVQVLGRLWFRVYSPSVSKQSAPPLRSVNAPWISGPTIKPTMLTMNRFVFLNEEGELTGSDSWNDPTRDKLWLYNLHYFDDLNAIDSAERTDWHRALIQRWVDENPPRVGNGWEPYPLSLRIVNWVKWALQGNDMEPAWLDSLATQTRFLRKRLEYHLLGNHLFANAKALVFAGLYFSGDEAEEWLEKGLGILAREVPEQVLGDGGHFERSPMYHSIILGDLLDLINVGRSFDLFSTRFALLQNWLATTLKMLAWMKTMTHPDGQVGFFNDTTNGIAHSFSQLDEYADKLDLKMPYVKGQGMVNLSDSGFIQICHSKAFALLDVGEIGPDYLPGHAHADTLSFELSLFGQRCIVNSGISQYGDGPERLRQRGTAAHSTVEINDENSSEVWGGFRVARRARPFGLKVEDTKEAISVSCSHDGYMRLKGETVHTREWRFEPGRMVVKDNIKGRFRQAVAYYHIHPDITVTYDDEERGGYFAIGDRKVSWTVIARAVSVEDSTYHPEFGLSVPGQVIKVAFGGSEVVFDLRWDE